MNRYNPQRKAIHQKAHGINRLPKLNRKNPGSISHVLSFIEVAKERGEKFSQQDRNLIATLIKAKRAKRKLNENELVNVIDFLKRHEHHSEAFEITHGEGPRKFKPKNMH
jgi:hypothetical protein